MKLSVTVIKGLLYGSRFTCSAMRDDKIRCLGAIFYRKVPYLRCEVICWNSFYIITALCTKEIAISLQHLQNLHMTEQPRMILDGYHSKLIQNGSWSPSPILISFWKVQNEIYWLRLETNGNYGYQILYLCIKLVRKDKKVSTQWKDTFLDRRLVTASGLIIRC